VAKIIFKSQAVISLVPVSEPREVCRSTPCDEEQGEWRPGEPSDGADGRRLMRLVGFVQARRTDSCCCGAIRGILGWLEGEWCPDFG